MKTIILYATKNGAAAEIANRIAGQIEGAVTHDLKQTPIPPLTDFDCVIVGSSIYAGMIRKEAKGFLTANTGLLSEKRLGLYISGMSMENEEGVLSTCFSEDLVKAAKAANVLGGIFDPAKSGFFARLIMKAVTKQSGYVCNISDEKIMQFADNMKTAE